MGVIQTIRGWFRRGGEAIMNMATDTKSHPWPPEAEVPRLRRYARNERIYLGQHESVFVGGTGGTKGKRGGRGEFRFQYDDNRDYVTVNLLGAMTNELSRRMCLEGVEVSAPEGLVGTQQFLDALRATSQLDMLHLLAAQIASYCGDVLYKVRYDSGLAEIRIEALNPCIVFPETSPLDNTDVRAMNLGLMLQGPRDAQDRYLWIERHELRDGAGWITNRLWHLTGNTTSGYRYDPAQDEVALTALAATEALLPEYATGIDELLVMLVHNRPTSGLWGQADYEGLLELQGELNNRLTQRAEVLDKHTDPWFYGPDLGGEDGEVRMNENKWIVTDPASSSSAPAGMIVWDAGLSSAVEAIRDCKESIAAVAGIDMDALIPQENAGPMSGRALRLRQMRTQATVQGKSLAFGAGLQQVYSLATRLAVAVGSDLGFRAVMPEANAPQPGEPVQERQPVDLTLHPLRPEQITITFGDGLPADRAEDIDDQTRMIEAGVQSRPRAIEVLHGMGTDDAIALAAEIQQEANQGAPSGAPAAGWSGLLPRGVGT